MPGCKHSLSFSFSFWDFSSASTMPSIASKLTWLILWQLLKIRVPSRFKAYCFYFSTSKSNNTRTSLYLLAEGPFGIWYVASTFHIPYVFCHNTYEIICIYLNYLVYKSRALIFVFRKIEIHTKYISYIQMNSHSSSLGGI